MTQSQSWWMPSWLVPAWEPLLASLGFYQLQLWVIGLATSSAHLLEDAIWAMRRDIDRGRAEVQAWDEHQ